MSNTETSIITSNVCQINLSNENIKNKHWCFQISKKGSQKNHFGILIYILSWKHLFEIYFRLLRRNNKLKINNFLMNIWHSNWRFNIWRRKRTPLMIQKIDHPIFYKCIVRGNFCSWKDTIEHDLLTVEVGVQF